MRHITSSCSCRPASLSLGSTVPYYSTGPNLLIRSCRHPGCLLVYARKTDSAVPATVKYFVVAHSVCSLLENHAGRNQHSESQLYNKYNINKFTRKITLESMKLIRLFRIIIPGVWVEKCFQLITRINLLVSILEGLASMQDLNNKAR